MKLYIVNDAEFYTYTNKWLYFLIADTGEIINQLFARDKYCAKSSLYDHNTEIQELCKEKFGEDVQVLFLGEDDMTNERLKELTKNPNNTLKLIIEEDLPVRSVAEDLLEYLRRDYEDNMITDWAHIKNELFITNIFDRMADYLLRIYYWSDLVPGLLDHWSEQIYYFYHDIPRQKGRHNRFPSKKMIYKTTCRVFEEYDFIDLKSCIRGLPGYRDLPDTIIREKGIEFCKKYLYWLSDKLSIYGKVEENEVKEIIKKLMNGR